MTQVGRSGTRPRRVLRTSARPHVVALWILLAVAVPLAACGESDGGPAGPSTLSSGSTAPSGTVTVFAAASLQEAFTSLATQFEAANRGTDVVLHFGPSSGLAEQIGQGAPADVFASASTKTMEGVVSDGDAAEATDFAVNTMAIAVPPDNPADIASVADLAATGVKLAVCQRDVPCGATALQVFDNANVDVTPVTEEVDVKAVLSKVRLGEVDAGMVYVTDVLAAADAVTGIEIPDDLNASTTYPIAILTGSQNKSLAQALVEYVLSPTGASVLTAAGFSKPT